MEFTSVESFGFPSVVASRPSPSPRRTESEDSGLERRSVRSARRRQAVRADHQRHKRYEPHVPALPHLSLTTAVVLDPPSNTHTRSVCIASNTLVTADRGGVRVYRERTTSCESGDPRLTAPTSGVWELKEVRDSFNLTDAYLTAAIQPVLRDDVMQTTPYSRYYCVATGSDRTVHSVCVLSTAGRFTLHHELHGRNKIVAMHFTQLALEALQEDKLTPFVLSVDEAGGVVLFNVARDAAVMLQRRDRELYQMSEHDLDSHRPAGGKVNPTLEEARILDEIHYYEVVNKPKAAASPFRRVTGDRDESGADSTMYRLESGLATQAVLIGPCVELCNRCHNVFSQPVARGPSPTSAAAPAAAGSAARFVALSVVIATRARDVDPVDERGEVGPAAAAVPEAELGVTFLRVLCSPSRAYVWHEIELVREAAPADVCDAGVALHAPAYLVGHPMTVLVARPRLRLWRLSGCTGQLLRTQRIYEDAEGGGAGKRCKTEFFIHWVPLGRHLLTQGTESQLSWFCVAAATDDDTLLLLGRDPLDARHALGHHENGELGVWREDTAAAASPLTASGDGVARAPQPRMYEQREREMLEAWLDEVTEEGQASAAARKGPAGELQPLCGAQRADVVEEKQSMAEPTKDYTVLVELYTACRSRMARASPHDPTRDPEERSLPSSAGGGSSLKGRESSDESRRLRSHHRRAVASEPTATPRVPQLGIKHVQADPDHSALYVCLNDDQTILRVALPFATALRTAADTARDGLDETGRIPERGEASRPISGDGSRGASPGPAQPALGGSLWASTRQALSTSAPGWFGLGSTPAAAGADVAVAPPREVTAEEVGHGFNIMRPLAVAVFGWGGSPRAPTPAATAAAHGISTSHNGSQPAAPITAAEPTSAALHDREELVGPAEHPQLPQVVDEHMAARLADPDEPYGETEGHGSARDSSSSPLPKRVEAVRITLQSPTSDHRRRRRKVREGDVEQTSPKQPLIESGCGQNDRLQRLYMQEQVQQALAAGKKASSQLQHDGSMEHQQQQQQQQRLVLEIAQLLQRDEPSARNRLLYAWQDDHNRFYIDFSLARDAMAEAAERRKNEAAAQATRERALYLREVAGTDLVLGGHTEAQGSTHDTTCNRSTLFTQQYSAIVDRRERLRDKKGVFGFAAYFSSGVLPQQLIDLQERDKCQFELADLALRQAKDLAALDPFDVVYLYQNEERGQGRGPRKGGHGPSVGGWRPHPTFPYDDDDGNVADIFAWNSTAGPRQPGAYVWAATEPAAATDAGGRSSPAVASVGSPVVRVRALTRELCDWTLGPWQYASHWPSTEESRAERGAGFHWSPTEQTDSRVRRRQLTRRRVNVRIQAARDQQIAEHLRQMEALRLELGL